MDRTRHNDFKKGLLVGLPTHPSLQQSSVAFMAADITLNRPTDLSQPVTRDAFPVALSAFVSLAETDLYRLRFRRDARPNACQVVRTQVVSQPSWLS